MQIPVVVATLDSEVYGLKDFSEVDLGRIREVIAKKPRYLPRRVAEREILTLRELKAFNDITTSALMRVIEDFAEVIRNLEKGICLDVYRSIETPRPFTRSRVVAKRSLMRQLHGTFMHAEYDKERDEIVVYTDAAVSMVLAVKAALLCLHYPLAEIDWNENKDKHKDTFEIGLRIPL